MRTGPPVGAHPAPTRLVSAPPRAAAWPCWWLHVAAVRERREEGGGEAELAALLLLLCAARHHALRLAPWQNHRLQKPHCSPHVSSPRPRLDEWAAELGKAPYGGVRGAGTPPNPPQLQRAELGAPPASLVPFPLPARWVCAPGNTGEQKSSGRKQRKREEACRWGAGELGAAPSPGGGVGSTACKPHASPSRSPRGGN